jgi:lyso-ornithine lipid O-acyltransferase
MTAIAIPRGEPASAYIRAIGRMAWITLALVPTLPLHAIWTVFKIPSPWPRLFLKYTARALGVHVRVVGRPQRRNVFFVANHLSWIDIPILGGITGTAFVAQDGVASWPFIGWLAKLNRTIFVSRTARQNVAAQVAELREAIAENWSITLFPEGTTSDGRGMLPFKQSLFATIAPPPRPLLIQPVLLDFGHVGPEIAWLGEETGWDSAWRAFTRQGCYRVTVHFLEPFDPNGMDRKETCTLARNRLASALSSTLGYTVS